MENMVENTKEYLVARQDPDLSELHISDLIGWPCCLPSLSPLKRHKLLSVHTVIYPEILSKVSSIMLSASMSFFFFFFTHTNI